MQKERDAENKTEMDEKDIEISYIKADNDQKVDAQWATDGLNTENVTLKAKLAALTEKAEKELKEVSDKANALRESMTEKDEYSDFQEWTAEQDSGAPQPTTECGESIVSYDEPEMVPPIVTKKIQKKKKKSKADRIWDVAMNVWMTDDAIAYGRNLQQMLNVSSSTSTCEYYIPVCVVFMYRLRMLASLRRRGFVATAAATTTTTYIPTHRNVNKPIRTVRILLRLLHCLPLSYLTVRNLLYVPIKNVYVLEIWQFTHFPSTTKKIDEST